MQRNSFPNIRNSVAGVRVLLYYYIIPVDSRVYIFNVKHGGGVKKKTLFLLDLIYYIIPMYKDRNGTVQICIVDQSNVRANSKEY